MYHKQARPPKSSDNNQIPRSKPWGYQKIKQTIIVNITKVIIEYLKVVSSIEHDHGFIVGLAANMN